MLLAFLLLISIAAAGLAWFIRSRNVHIWLPDYLRRRRQSEVSTTSPVHILFCICDHYEPRWNDATYEQETSRVENWHRRLPQLAARHRDADGIPLQYTFFYPEEEYRPEHLDKLADLKQRGFADVEIHLHHDHDTAAGLTDKLNRFKQVLHERHGLLHRNPATGQVEYAFIHGDWALDNCGRGRSCGVNNELTVLQQTGCYADFTLPAAPEPEQTRTVNSIYYAQDDPQQPKSHDTGIEARAGALRPEGLLLIQGPLALNWKWRKFGIFPRIENGELSAENPPSPERVDLWVRQNIHVQGRPDWVFVKVYAHGANERHSAVLLGEPMDRMLRHLESRYNDGRKFVLHYVTARETYNIVRAAEQGLSGSPGQFRNFAEAGQEGARA